MRRCATGEACGIGTPRKFAFLDMPVANILSRPEKDWNLITGGQRGRVAKHVMDVDWKSFLPEENLFTHCSIVSSVQTNETGYQIVEPCDELVNVNGNAWTNGVLPNCFKTFVGGQNYYEHVQVPELSKGRILDAVLRPVTYIGGDGKKQASVYYVDILIATHRKHHDIVGRVETGRLNTLSMGAIANMCQCSFCGKRTDDDHPNCIHLNNSVRQYLKAKDGKKYIVAELCGACDDKGVYIPNSCVFIEASWVENPAFAGAVVNYLVDSPKVASNRFAEHSFSFDLLLDSSILSQLRVADVHSMVAIRLALKELRAQKYMAMAQRISSGK